MTGDRVDRKLMAFGHLSDLEMASKVRMLMRSDLDHEPVCTGARDRIMFLSQKLDDVEKLIKQAIDEYGSQHQLREALSRIAE